MKHTPGPWALNADGYIMAPQPEEPKQGEELPPEYEVASIGDGSPHLTAREKADAALICAAPLMRELLTQIYLSWESIPEDAQVPDEMNVDWIWEAVRNLMATS